MLSNLSRGPLANHYFEQKKKKGRESEGEMERIHPRGAQAPGVAEELNYSNQTQTLITASEKEIDGPDERGEKSVSKICARLGGIK